MVPITQTDSLAVVQFPWGTLQWICDSALFPGANQTLGLCEIHPGARNPVHYHPNCEEVLTMLSGHGRHSYEGESVELRPGTTIHIPAGVKHNFENTGADPIRCLIAFSSGERQTVFLE